MTEQNTGIPAEKLELTRELSFHEIELVSGGGRSSGRAASSTVSESLSFSYGEVIFVYTQQR